MDEQNKLSTIKQAFGWNDEQLHFITDGLDDGRFERLFKRATEMRDDLVDEGLCELA